LLKRDDLNIDEAVAWDSLIQWGIQQTPGLGSKNNNRTKWNHENYEALKRTLSKFIPLIRFSEISSADFFDKVLPFEAIIPNNIYEEALEYYMKNTLPKKTTILPPRIRIQIESKIIKPKLAFVITNWIKKRDANAIRNKNDTSYNFDLIYRGSRDGINDISFNNKCNLQEPILVLIKCKNSQKIFGGYTSVGFYRPFNENSGYIFSTDSFIFSFEESDNFQYMKLSRVILHDYAIYNNYNGGYGFCFGDCNLFMQNGYLCVNNSDCYYKINLCHGTFMIEEIEAFRVIKK